MLLIAAFVFEFKNMIVIFMKEARLLTRQVAAMWILLKIDQSAK